MYVCLFLRLFVCCHVVRLCHDDDDYNDDDDVAVVAIDDDE